MFSLKKLWSSVCYSEFFFMLMLVILRWSFIADFLHVIPGGFSANGPYFYNPEFLHFLYSVADPGCLFSGSDFFHPGLRVDKISDHGSA